MSWVYRFLAQNIIAPRTTGQNMAYDERPWAKRCLGLPPATPGGALLCHPRRFSVDSLTPGHSLVFSLTP